MSSLKVALLGFGTVGQGVYKSVQSHQTRLQSLLGKKVEIVAVLVKDEKKKRNLDSNVLVSSDIEQILNIPDLDVVIEAIVGVEPGYTYLSNAIDRGLHVITANKELLAHKGKSLREKAQHNNVRFEYEAAVAGGIPVISTLKHLIRVNGVVKIEAILNGTSNYILTDMITNQSSFNDSLLAAQQKGYAEEDPGNDIDGWDAFYKLMIISDLLFDKQPGWEQVVRKGIRNIEYSHMLAADSIGGCIKHVAMLENANGVVKAAVEPVLLPKSHSLSTVDGVNNAVIVTGDLVGELKLQGPGAGALPTASAMLEDLTNIYYINDRQPIGRDVSFSSSSGVDEQDWLFVGPVVPANNVTVHDKWEIEHARRKVTCWRITGKESDIRSLLASNTYLSGFKIETSKLTSEELSKV